MSQVMEKAQLLLMMTRNPCELHVSPLHSARQQCGVVNICYHHQTLQLENEQHETLTVNTETYWDILENFLTPAMHCACMQNLWFQQNGKSQTAKICMEMLQNIFPG